MANALPEINHLSKDERLSLMERLWESFERHSEDLPLTDTQRDELDRRVEAMEKDGDPGIPWEQVVQKIRDKRIWEARS